jgi:hypothetical protein
MECTIYNGCFCVWGERGYMNMTHFCIRRCQGCIRPTDKYSWLPLLNLQSHVSALSKFVISCVFLAPFPSSRRSGA